MSSGSAEKIWAFQTSGSASNAGLAISFSQGTPGPRAARWRTPTARIPSRGQPTPSGYVILWLRRCSAKRRMVPVGGVHRDGVSDSVVGGAGDVPADVERLGDG